MEENKGKFLNHNYTKLMLIFFNRHWFLLLLSFLIWQSIRIGTVRVTSPDNYDSSSWCGFPCLYHCLICCYTDPFQIGYIHGFDRSRTACSQHKSILTPSSRSGSTSMLTAVLSSPCSPSRSLIYVMHCTFLTLLDDDNTFRLPLGIGSGELHCLEAVVRQQQPRLRPQDHRCDHHRPQEVAARQSPEVRAQVHHNLQQRVAQLRG